MVNSLTPIEIEHSDLSIPHSSQKVPHIPSHKKISTNTTKDILVGGEGTFIGPTKATRPSKISHISTLEDILEEDDMVSLSNDISHWGFQVIWEADICMHIQDPSHLFMFTLEL